VGESSSITNLNFLSNPSGDTISPAAKISPAKPGDMRLFMHYVNLFQQVSCLRRRFQPVGDKINTIMSTTKQTNRVEIRKTPHKSLVDQAAHYLARRIASPGRPPINQSTQSTNLPNYHANT
jgi:hypothetical protein